MKIIKKKQMPKQHNIEYKTSWHKCHLKTICTFANSQGGAFFVRAKIKKIITSSNNNLIFSFVKQKDNFVSDHLNYSVWVIGTGFPEDT